MKCRHCGAALTLQMIDLGASPPSNAFNATQDVQERHYPLRVMVCSTCWLVQTDISLFELDHDALFTEDYPYFSSTSAGWVKHAREFVAEVTERFSLGPDSLAVEVGANDGYLLQWFKTPCYGVEPTRTGDKAREKGLTIYPHFFTSAWAESAREWGLGADFMIANNVLAHVPDVNDFVKGFAILLKPEGVASFEFPHLLNLVQQGQFDTIYHEHYSYLSLAAVRRIFEKQGLYIFDVEQLPTHGGSLRVYASKHRYSVSDRVGSLLNVEIAAGVETPEFYAGFQARAEEIKNELMAFLLKAKALGRTVAGFGAAAKGNTVLNYSGVRADLLPYVVDETPSKQGKFLPGSRIPVVAHFMSQPDYVLILPWNFKDEIMAKLAYIRACGGRFVTAIPRLEIQ